MTFFLPGFEQREGEQSMTELSPLDEPYLLSIFCFTEEYIIWSLPVLAIPFDYEKAMDHTAKKEKNKEWKHMSKMNMRIFCTCELG